MKYRFFLPILAVVACADPASDPGFELPRETETSEALPFFGNGYRAEGDPCRRIGENGYTNQFLDDAADLVGCPEDMENLGVFVSETGAIPLARTQGTVLFSIPTR